GAVVLLGSDSPTLPGTFVAEAFRLLETADVVLGPATDGGYYLLGCARRRPPVFDGIDWGSPHVLEQTIACLADPAWRVALLPPWYDVDTLDDWRMLRGHLAALRRAGGDADLPHTLALLSEPEASARDSGCPRRRLGLGRALRAAVQPATHLPRALP